MLSKILPGGAAEQAGKLTEGTHCARPLQGGPGLAEVRSEEVLASQAQASSGAHLLLSGGSLGGSCLLAELGFTSA